jgi:O-antigen/teichoic acid export membrane protein
VSDYGRGARVLSVGIATTGLVTFAYFSLASHALSEVDYKGISLLWSVLFLIVSIIYRPVEQLLSRTIAAGGHPLRTGLTIQAAFAALFAAVALAARDYLQNQVFDGSAALYWVLVVAVLAYAASYFARGWLAGHKRFGLYGGLVLLESVSRCLFALLAVAGLATSQGFVAMGIAAAPLVSLVVVPWALRRRARPPEGEPAALTLREGGAFAGAVLVIMAAEQALLNGPVILADAASANPALAGFVFNVLLITRAPLQLFQAVQTSLLPHLSSTSDGAEFSRALRMTVLAIAGFTAAVALGLAALGPLAMDVLFGGDFAYDRAGLVLVGLGMGFHLTAGTLNQAALARGRAAHAAAAWVASALAFTGWMALSPLDDPLWDVQAGYPATVALLALCLWLIERSGARRG